MGTSARTGRAFAFRFKDWTDYQATQETLGTGDGTRTNFQLVKHYTSGGITETRIITKPVPGTVQVYKNTTLQKSGAAYTVTGAVTEVETTYAFTDSDRTELGDYFSYGLLTFTSGANSGLSMEVRECSTGRFSLFLPMPNPIVVGDTYTAMAGCDKTFETCVLKFSNALNFRGEPHVPGTDRILETSATRSS